MHTTEIPTKDAFKTATKHYFYAAAPIPWALCFRSVRPSLRAYTVLGNGE